LGEVSLEERDGEARLLEMLGHARRPVLGACEDEDRIRVRAVQDLHEQRRLEVLLDGVQGVGDRGHRRRLSDLHGDGVFQDVPGQVPDFIGHGCREQQGLPLGGDSAQDPSDIGHEAHVEHAVRLVQDQHLHVGEVDDPLLHEVQKPPRAGHDDLGALLELLDLGVLLHTAIHGDALHIGLAAQLAHGLVDLLGQFARGGDDEGTDALARPRHQPLQDRQAEGGRFPRAGLGHSHDIAALQDQGDALGLDRRGLLVPEGLDACLNLRM